MEIQRAYICIVLLLYYFCYYRFWTESYAKSGEGASEVHPAVRRLMDMGFPEDKVREALLANKSDENAAIEALLSSM